MSSMAVPPNAQILMYLINLYKSLVFRTGVESWIYLAFYVYTALVKRGRATKNERFLVVGNKE